MNARRLDRVNELIRTELGTLLLHEIRDPRLSRVMSVTSVDVSADLESAKVHVTVLGGAEEKRETIHGLRMAAGFLRRRLSQRADLRNTPELRFLLDESIEQGDKVLNLIREANVPQSSGEEPRPTGAGQGEA